MVTQSDTGDGSCWGEMRFQPGTDSTWITDVHEYNVGDLIETGVCVLSHLQQRLLVNGFAQGRLQKAALLLKSDTGLKPFNFLTGWHAPDANLTKSTNHLFRFKMPVCPAAWQKKKNTKKKTNQVRQGQTRCADMNLGQISVLPDHDEIHAALKRNL